MDRTIDQQLISLVDKYYMLFMKVKTSLLICLLLGFVASGQSKIAYLSNKSGNFDIHLMDADGSNSKQLTTNLGWDWSPKWNKSLKAILYNSNDTLQKFSIKAIDALGKEVAFDSQALEEVILSPNGTDVLYTLKDKNNRYIGLYSLTNKSNRLLVTHPSYNGRPSWSPSGTTFAFISERDGNPEIYLYILATGAQKRLTQTEKREKYMSWGPKGDLLYYTYHYSDEKDLEHNDIFQVHVDSGSVVQITNDPEFYQEIAVSPDGKQIVFHAKRDGKHQLYTLGTDGKNEQQITSGDSYFGEPEWIPQE
ncbi:MAG: hypothetical protein KTR22_08280 [Flavobacteriaceae bacterium]|nr:hypothetical protein [Flavobacteriaceae bacterium]